MENQIVQRLTKLQEYIDLYNELKGALRPDIRPIDRQTLTLRIRSLEKRIRSLKQELHNTIICPIYDITYMIGNNAYHARLTNMSKEDAIKLITFSAQVQDSKIEILEIKESQTFLR